jgi:acyl-CoA reductase-like NAD-dependent aldehyde dehydrogenase
MSETPNALVSRLRKTFLSGKTLPYTFRLHQLQQLRKLVTENTEEIISCLKKDLRSQKNHYSFEVDLTRIDYAIEHLKELMEPEPRYIEPLETLTTGWLVKQPYGVTLIMTCWNYPFFLFLGPAVGAIAAGNCMIVKPSELSEHCSKLITRLLPKYLDKDCYVSFEGRRDAVTKLLEEKLDYILFTGNPAIGKVVMAAASKHLTPVTLELGGKSPVIVDQSADLEVSAKRIAFAKINNTGQVCIAPDYLFIHKDVEEKFLELFKKYIKEFFGPDPQKSEHFSRIISKKHMERIKDLMEGQKFYFGGKIDMEDKYVEPSIIRNVDPESKIMKEEIFAPILPTMTYTNLDEVVKFINAREKPLGLYLFSKREENIKKIMNHTYAGAFVLNDCSSQLGYENLPFGGVGHSGIGAYGGKNSFYTFTHCKPVMLKTFSEYGTESKYPPYK